MAGRYLGELRVEARGLHGLRGESLVPRKVLPAYERATAVRHEHNQAQVREMRIDARQL